MPVPEDDDMQTTLKRPAPATSGVSSYAVVTSENLLGLAGEVLEYVHMGYEPVGGPAYGPTSQGSGYYVWAQAMIKRA